jgi:hypothetical protein
MRQLLLIADDFERTTPAELEVVPRRVQLLDLPRGLLQQPDLEAGPRGGKVGRELLQQPAVETARRIRPARAGALAVDDGDVQALAQAAQRRGETCELSRGRTQFRRQRTLIRRDIMPLAYTCPLPQGGATQRDTAERAPHPGSHYDHVELWDWHEMRSYTNSATPVTCEVLNLEESERWKLC